MSASFVLGSQTSSMYPGGYAPGVCSPAASLSEHFEQPAGIGIQPESDLQRFKLGGRICAEPTHKSESLTYDA